MQEAIYTRMDGDKVMEQWSVTVYKDGSALCKPIISKYLRNNE